MDEMDIYGPDGGLRYRVHTDNQVEDLTHKHERHPTGDFCIRCGWLMEKDETNATRSNQRIPE